jgi:hypothetical protein
VGTWAVNDFDITDGAAWDAGVGASTTCARTTVGNARQSAPTATEAALRSDPAVRRGAQFSVTRALFVTAMMLP